MLVHREVREFLPRLSHSDLLLLRIYFENIYILIQYCFFKDNILKKEDDKEANLGDTLLVFNTGAEVDWDEIQKTLFPVLPDTATNEKLHIEQMLKPLSSVTSEQRALLHKHIKNMFTLIEQGKLSSAFTFVKIIEKLLEELLGKSNPSKNFTQSMNPPNQSPKIFLS